MYTLLVVEFDSGSGIDDCYQALVDLDVNTMYFKKAPLIMQLMGKIFGQYEGYVYYGYGYLPSKVMTNDLEWGVLSIKPTIRTEKPWLLKLLQRI
jgi:hypothetical protein